MIAARKRKDLVQRLFVKSRAGKTSKTSFQLQISIVYDCSWLWTCTYFQILFDSGQMVLAWTSLNSKAMVQRYDENIHICDVNVVLVTNLKSCEMNKGGTSKLFFCQYAKKYMCEFILDDKVQHVNATFSNALKSICKIAFSWEKTAQICKFFKCAKKHMWNYLYN